MEVLMRSVRSERRCSTGADEFLKGFASWRLLRCWVSERYVLPPTMEMGLGDHYCFREVLPEVRVDTFSSCFSNIRE